MERGRTAFPYFGMRGNEDEQNLRLAFDATKLLYEREFCKPMVHTEAHSCWHDCSGAAGTRAPRATTCGSFFAAVTAFTELCGAHRVSRWKAQGPKNEQPQTLAPAQCRSGAHAAVRVCDLV